MLTIRPIHTDKDYHNALAELETLMDAKPGTADGDRLDVLATLIEVYESQYYPIGLPDPIAAIQIRMDEKGLSRRDLEPAIGTRARVSEILHRQRALTLPMIRNLSHLLDLPTDVLVQPYTLVGDQPTPEPARRMQRGG